MTYFSNQHGRAEYNSWMHIPSADFQDIVQGDESEILKDRYYAQLVYQVNSPPITISGDISVGAVGIDGSGDVALSGDSLKVYDGALVEQLEILNRNTQVLVQYDNPSDPTYTYVMESLPGVATSGETGWRIKRVYNGDFLTVMWADGVDTYTKTASAYLSYNYTFKV